MKQLVLSLLIAASLSPAARAEEPQQQEYTGFLNMIYARPFGIKSVADEADKHEKARDRLGTGLIVLMPNGGGPLLPSKPPVNPE